MKLFYILIRQSLLRWVSGKDYTCSAGDAGDVGSNPGLRRFPGVGNGNHSSNLAWKVPWTEEPGYGVSRSRTQLSN